MYVYVCIYVYIYVSVDEPYDSEGHFGWLACWIESTGKYNQFTGYESDPWSKT